VIGLETFDHQVVDWQPDRTSPVAVATEERRLRLRWFVSDGSAEAVQLKVIRILRQTLVKSNATVYSYQLTPFTD